jgi:hypothetical protein
MHQTALVDCEAPLVMHCRWADKRTTKNGASVQLFQAVFPITRLPAVVRNGQDPDVRRHFQVDDVIGENATRLGVERSGQLAVDGRGHRREASPRFDQWLRQRRRRTRCPSVLAEPRTIGQRSDIRRPPRRQSEREDSPLAKFGFGAAAHVVPGHSTGLVCQRPPGSPFDFGGPGGFDIGWALRRRVVKAGQQFGRNVRAFLEG